MEKRRTTRKTYWCFLSTSISGMRWRRFAIPRSRPWMNYRGTRRVAVVEPSAPATMHLAIGSFEPRKGSRNVTVHGSNRWSRHFGSPSNTFAVSRSCLLVRLPELAGRELACWRAPAPCHGNVLVMLFDKLVRAPASYAEAGLRGSVSNSV